MPAKVPGTPVPKPEAKKEPLFTKKVVSLTEYLTRAKKLLTDSPEKCDGMKRTRDIALSLLYSENEVVDTFQVKGETVFVCER